AAQSNSSSQIVCVAGQCLQGVANTSIGATLSIPSNPSILLLPGQYPSSSQPQLLHDALSSQRATLSLPSGFSNSTASSITPSLPLTIALQPGVLSYSQSLYKGQATFTQLPSTANFSTPTLPSGSFLVAPNTWAALTSSNTRLIVWDAIPDFAQLPPSTASGSLTLTDIQSAACPTPCASTGICTPAGTCSCQPGFNGTSCETCASGFFGPECQPCPSNCETCDQGLTGTGKCLVPTVTNPPSSCNCLNGVCGTNGQCTCNPGWANSNNGTACASCAPGFFLDSSGNCSICQLGCTQCSDGTGQCTACKTGFTQNANDRTRCVSVSSIPGSTTQQCPDGSFTNNGNCTLCSPTCKTCSGPTSSDCIVCGAGQYTLNGQCVGTDANGICSGTSMVANNVKEECDSCPAKCTACKIPNFNAASTIDQAQCTGCLPGFVLSQGKCLAQCPSGTFLGTDNLTCTPCDSTCTTCVDNSKFCLACASNQLASNGTCVTSCPSNTFSSSGACLSCHPDCATCTGSAFNQCSTCPSSRPVLSSTGRCLPTCAKNQYLDPSSAKCVQCDSSCSSCAGPGSNQCMACADQGNVLTSGTCAPAKCTSQSGVVPGLGVCLSDLVAVPNPTATPPPLPTFTPPAPVTAPSNGSRRLAWWEILLMALGCAFIFVMFMWLWRRRARKQRAKQTALFARKLSQRAVWRKRFGRVADFFKGANTGVNGGRSKFGLGHHYVKETEYQKLQRLRDEESKRHAMEMDKLEGKIAKSSVVRQPSITSDHDDPSYSLTSPKHNRASAPSLYSQLTRLPRSGPEPKQPTHDLDLERGDLLSSRFSVTTRATSIFHNRPEELPPLPARYPSEAERIVEEHRLQTAQQPVTSYWLVPADTLPAHTGTLVPAHTGGSTGSKNPFRLL
ncbi:insulin-like growth factor binding protein, partial [Hysterangium stoloniferum]